MIRCQHGQKITKFCITEHCHHKQAAGCDYCIKKYHFHLTNTSLLSETDLETIVKTLTSPSDCKYKSKALQDLAGEYLRQLRQALTGWFEQAQSAISDRLTHPYLRKHGLLPTYQRIRNRDFRKINAKELKGINEFAKNSQPESFKRQQIQTYFAEVEWTASIIEAAESIAKQFAKLPLLKQADSPTLIQRSPKLNETFESILREKDRYQSQIRSSQKETQVLRPESTKLEQVIKSSSLMKNRLTRELSGKEKSSTPNKDIVNDILGRKMQAPEVTPQRIGSIVPVTLAEPNVQVQERFGNETREEKARRLRRRRSSIDEGIADMKFGQQDRDRQMKELVDLKKKKILETVFSSRGSEKEKEKESVQSKVETQNTVDDPPKQEEGKEQASNRSSRPGQTGRGKSAEKIKETTNIPDNRSEASSNKDSEQNFFESIFQKGGINVAELINSLIPPPPATRHNNENEVVTNKVVKIPIADKQHIDEIQSPIFKNKRKMDRQHHPTGGFGISLNPVQNKQEELPLPAVKEELKEETESFIPNTKAKSTKPAPEEDVIELQSNQTNSLCLFSEAVKSSSEKAIQLLKAALKYSPDNLSAAEYLSYLYLQSGKSKECLEVCESILLRIQDKAEEFQVTLHLHNNRAAALNMLGRYSESIVVLEKCLKFRRKHYFYKNLADAYFSLGIPEKAAMNYQKAIRLDPGYDQAFYNLAVTQFIQEEYTSAKLNIDHALKIDSINETYRELEREISKRIENIMK